jgi:hypothetical protein
MEFKSRIHPKVIVRCALTSVEMTSLLFFAVKTNNTVYFDILDNEASPQILRCANIIQEHAYTPHFRNTLQKSLNTQLMNTWIGCGTISWPPCSPDLSPSISSVRVRLTNWAFRS